MRHGHLARCHAVITAEVVAVRWRADYRNFVVGFDRAELHQRFDAGAALAFEYIEQNGNFVACWFRGSFHGWCLSLLVCGCGFGWVVARCPL